MKAPSTLEIYKWIAINVFMLSASRSQVHQPSLNETWMKPLQINALIINYVVVQILWALHVRIHLQQVYESARCRSIPESWYARNYFSLSEISRKFANHFLLPDWEIFEKSLSSGKRDKFSGEKPPENEIC